MAASGNYADAGRCVAVFLEAAGFGPCTPPSWNRPLFRPHTRRRLVRPGPMPARLRRQRSVSVARSASSPATVRRADAESALENYGRDTFAPPPPEDPAMTAVQAPDSSPQGLLRATQVRVGSPARRASANTEALVNRIAFYAQLAQPEKAETAYRKAITLDPRSAKGSRGIGGHLRRQPGPCGRPVQPRRDYGNLR